MGYRNTKTCPLAPTIDAFVTDGNREQVEKLTTALFSKSDNYLLWENGLNRPLAYSILASMLMYLKTLEPLHQPGEENIITQAIFTEAATLEVEKPTLYEWGDKVKQRFMLEVDRASELNGVKDVMEKSINSINNFVKCHEDVTKVLLEVENASQKTESNLSKLQADVNEIKTDMKSIKQDMKDLTMALQNVLRTGNIDLISTSNTNITSCSSLTQDTNNSASSSDSTPKKNVNDSLMKGQQDKKLNVDGPRFQNGHPHLMTASTFAARVLIYGKIFIRGEDVFTFKIGRSEKSRCKAVDNLIRSHLTETEKGVKHSSIQEKDEPKIYDMFGRAQERMMNDVYTQMEQWSPTPFKRPTGILPASELQVGVIGSKLEKITNWKNQKSGEKKNNKRKRTKK